MIDADGNRAVDEAIREAAERLPDVAWYGFGSFFQGATAYGDIDILAVCPDPETGVAARAALSALCAAWPVDLTIMTYAEADETDFVLAQGCQRLA
jgi:hypothetical protein